MKKLLFGLLFLSGTSYASCMGPYCWDDVGAKIHGGAPTTVIYSTNVVLGANHQNISLVTPPAGLYRISVYNVVVSAAGSATVVVTPDWVDSSGTTQNPVDTTAIALGTPGAIGYGTILAEVDGTHPIRYSNTVTGSYASATFRMYLNIESLN